MQLRSKKERIEAFISRVNVDTQVTADWRRFVLEQEEAKQPVVYERKPVSQLPYPMAAEEAAPYGRTENKIRHSNTLPQPVTDILFLFFQKYFPGNIDSDPYLSYHKYKRLSKRLIE